MKFRLEHNDQIIPNPNDKNQKNIKFSSVIIYDIIIFFLNDELCAYRSPLWIPVFDAYFDIGINGKPKQYGVKKTHFDPLGFKGVKVSSSKQLRHDIQSLIAKRSLAFLDAKIAGDDDYEV